MFSGPRVLGVWGLLLPVVALFVIACGAEEEAPAAEPDLAPRTGSTGDASPDATQAPASFTVEERDAPIASISIIVMETDPPQYQANVTVVQPDGCATFGHVQAGQELGATEIVLLARNEVVVGEGVVCTDAISTFVQSVPLGIDFEPGVTYTVAGGGATASFTAQGEPPFFSYDRFFAEIDSLVGVAEAGEFAQPFTTIVPRLIEMSGGTIQVYEFESIVDAIEMVVRVENSEAIEWVDTPNFFRRGNVVAIYVGQDEGVVKAVSLVTRDFFARPFEPDAPPEADEPPVVSGEEPTPTPAPFGEHRLFVKVTREGDGFRFIGELIGGADNERSLYCVGTTWLPGDGVNITAMPGCLEYTPDIEIQRHFEFTHTYSEPGVYQVVLKVGPLTSKSVEVVYEPADYQATATPAPFGNGAASAGPSKMVWPTLLSVDPEVAAPGEGVEIIGQGGYLFTPPSGYNESARGFEVFFDGEVAGEVSCYVNRCEGRITVPDSATEGMHAISVDGGSELELEVKG
ncbi:MAG: hypothetical protein IH961_10835 [Chloroflexi bacterium]|nr:hypothetical protein [Chloroflexota bacterium]